MRKLTCILLVELSFLTNGCGNKLEFPPLPINPNSPATPVTHANNATSEAQTSRYDLWNRLIRNGSNIILRVRGNSAVHMGSVELSHTDSSGETCRITTVEFRSAYCCNSMLRVFMRGGDAAATESPAGCMSRHFGSVIGSMPLETLSRNLMGGASPDNYHFEHSPGRMTLNPLVIDTEDGDFVEDRSIAIRMETHPDLPIYADPTNGTGARRNNIIGAWRIIEVQTGL